MAVKPSRWLWLLLAVALTLAWLGSAQAQELGDSLQTTTDLSIILSGDITFAVGDGTTSTTSTFLAWDSWVAGLGISDGFGNQFAGAPLVWNGRAFRMEFSAADVFWSAQGTLSADGMAVERLTATQRIASCSNPHGCESPTDYDETTFDLEGPIPFAEVEEMLDFDDTLRVCANFRLTGEEIVPVVNKVDDVSVWPGDSKQFVSIDYAAAELTVTFCGKEALGGRAAPEGLAWEFAGSASYVPEAAQFPFCYTNTAVSGSPGWTSTGMLCTATAADGSLSGDVGPICAWEGDVSLEEPTPIDSDLERPTGVAHSWRDMTTYCEAGGSTVSWNSYHSWAVPPYYLVPGQETNTELGVASETTDTWPPPAADTILLLYPEGLNLDEGLVPSQYAASPSPVGQLGAATIGGEIFEDSPQRHEILGITPWTVPAGKPGDRLALGIFVRGPGGQRVVVYEYEMRTLRPDALPETGEEPQPEEPFDEEGFGEDPGALEIPADLLDRLPPGFGDLGAIPGPENLIQALAGILGPATLIAILSALGHMGGSGSGVDPLSLLPRAPSGQPPLTLTDALGRQFTYEWDPDTGGYINPETGGMLNQTLWDEYNRNLAGNQAFIQTQREKLANRDTAFDREMDRMLANQKEQAALLSKLKGLQAAGYGLGADGARASARAAELIRQVGAGAPLSPAEVAAIDRFIGHRQGGQSMAESDLGPISNWTIAADTATGSVRTVFTGRNPDASTSWAAIAGRVGLAVATLGSSEYVFTPVEAAYVFKDGLDQGQSTGRALAGSAGTVIFGVVLGKAAGAAMTVGGKVFGVIGRGVTKVFPGLARGMAEGVEGLGKEFRTLGKAASEAWEAVGQRLGRGLPNQNVKLPIPTARLDGVNRMVQRALSTGDDQALLNLYRNGGMKHLARLEQLGHINPQQARVLNNILGRGVNQSIQTGTKSTMQTFQQRSGVEIAEVLVGDSGSSARGAIRSVMTDFDRTVVVRFEPKSLANYARQNGISTAEAQKRLSRQFTDMVQDQVDNELTRTLGLNAGDVDFKAYNGIGAGAGPADSYPLGFTNARQGVWGRTDVYRPGAQSPYTTSGQAIVDENAMQTARFGGSLPPDPTRIGQEEMRSLIQQQVNSAAGHTDVKSLAKALGRADYAGARLGYQLDPELTAIARQITANPQEMNQILQQNGMTAGEFVQQSQSVIGQLGNAVGVP